MKSIHLLILPFILISFGLAAQEKLEREYSISAGQVPEKALRFVADNYAGKRVSWYREENLQGQNIEAKLKKDKQWHSVEFDTLGNLQDVEVQIRYRDIDDDLREEMEEAMEDLFSAYKIDKVQRQWSGKEDAIVQLIGKGQSTQEYTLRYEIVVRGRKEGKTDFYELLFDDGGELLKKARIIERSVNHLIF